MFNIALFANYIKRMSFVFWLKVFA